MEQKHATRFEDLGISPEMIKVLSEIKLTSPTPIQSLAIPQLMNGEDIKAKSFTGSGKTFAFGIPLIERINIDLKYIQGLIICPTRELANQVLTELRKIGRRHQDLKIVSLVGGEANGREQAQSLRRGAHIAVGTPGRILDHLNRNQLDLAELQYFVFDEADKLLEMGFEKDIADIFERFPQPLQGALFSATFPKEVSKLADTYLKEAKSIEVLQTEEQKPDITHVAYLYRKNESKQHTFIRALNAHAANSVIVFCNTKQKTTELAQLLQDKGLTALALNGDIEQKEREKTLILFRNKSLPVLIATDVAARGIDITGLDLVINYDLPESQETYIHRAGRTGRAGAKGTCVSLYHEEETLFIHDLGRTLGSMEQPKLGFENQWGFQKNHFLPEMKTIAIYSGRKDKIRPGDILGVLTGEEVGLTANDVGKIDITDHTSFVAIRYDRADEAVHNLRKTKIKARKIVSKLIDISLEV
ncbi:MAG: ATP-dependent RNA helicase DbpA [Bdellovibrionia bacterium]